MVMKQKQNISDYRKVVALAPLCHASAGNFVLEVISVPAFVSKL
jgi:hypothetical protein